MTYITQCFSVQILYKIWDHFINAISLPSSPWGQFYSISSTTKYFKTKGHKFSNVFSVRTSVSGVPGPTPELAVVCWSSEGLQGPFARDVAQSQECLGGVCFIPSPWAGYTLMESRALRQDSEKCPIQGHLFGSTVRRTGSVTTVPA